jgi:hypothetical protein
MRITKVERIENPHLENRFHEKQKALMQLRGPSEAQVLVAYHGTPVENIPSIGKDNLRIEYLGRNCGDRGCYGAGCYLTPSSSVGLEYSSYGPILQFDVLPGRVYTVAQYPALGIPLRDGFDSHRSHADSSGCSSIRINSCRDTSSHSSLSDDDRTLRALSRLRGLHPSLAFR